MPGRRRHLHRRCAGTGDGDTGRERGSNRDALRERVASLEAALAEAVAIARRVLDEE